MVGQLKHKASGKWAREAEDVYCPASEGEKGKGPRRG